MLVRRKIPSWSGAPRTASQRDAYAIAAQMAPAFARAFRAAVERLLSEPVLEAMRRELALHADPERALARLPEWRADDPALGALHAAMRDTLVASGRAEQRRLGLRTEFSITKARNGNVIPIVASNPYAVRWIDRRAGDLIREIGGRQRKAIRDLLHRGFAQGLRAEAMIDQIRQRVGLLDREERAVENRRQLHLDAGIAPDRADRMAGRYASSLLDKRAMRIARTETIAAQAEGRKESWLMARDSGELAPDVKQRWVTAPASPRTCPICEELDGQETELDGQFQSSEIGALGGAPAHPSCRCTSEIVQ